ncbi:MAG: hypothetical protein L3J02_03205 [Henriciella sp.]|nr:hypothetical protein [Henriciella sp.]
MVDQRPVSVPAASSIVFQGAIEHPDLWLWDSWLLKRGEELHLYCLGLNRIAGDGSAIQPSDRNQFPFHIRHFVSTDDARTWSDYGALIQPGGAVDGSDKRNIWSGSTAILPDASVLFAYTGIRESSADRSFLQTILLGRGETPNAMMATSRVALSDPVMDYSEICACGYYLGPRETLGDNDGEEGGPILAWRDPFIFVDSEETVHLFWSAKTGPKTPAIAHAILKSDGINFSIDRLLPPLLLPDSDKLTQAEVPKIYHDDKGGLYYLLISACNRLYEGQPDHEVTKEHRLYKSSSLDGPWQPYDCGDSLVPGLSGLFGASLIDADFESGEFRFIAPYTEMAQQSLQLTFPSVKTVNIYRKTKEGAEQTA